MNGYRDVTRIYFLRDGTVQSFTESTGTTVVGGCLLRAQVTPQDVSISTTPCVRKSADSPFTIGSGNMNIGLQEPASKLFDDLGAVLESTHALDMVQPSPNPVPSGEVAYEVAIDRCAVTTSFQFAVDPNGTSKLDTADSAVADLYMRLQAQLLAHVHIGTIP